MGYGGRASCSHFMVLERGNWQSDVVEVANRVGLSGSMVGPGWDSISGV